MLPSLKKWFRERRLSAEAHASAWRGHDTVEQDGLTRFQHLAMSALSQDFGQQSFERQGKKETYLRWLPPGSKTFLFIYRDGAEIHGPMAWRAEHWDYPTPHDLITQMLVETKLNIERESKPLFDP